jgi:ABC-type transport system involved in multi-copper enzyme maturation permease subunit
MISFRNIKAVARYERKILFRSWFFRIFAILTLVILGFFHGVSIFQRSPFTWNLKALPSALIYNSMMMFNIVQSIIAIFLASDFMKRDKKLDTSEVLFIRPMSNADYVLGKTWGIVTLFVSLNIVIMALMAILTFASGEIGFQWQPYLYYFLLLSIPSLVFVLGLSFFLMGVLKNQAITFLLLLAYIAAILFFLADKAWFLFDYLSFKRPFIYIYIIRFSDLQRLVFHRLVYFLAGIGFIIASVLMLKRLEQSKVAPMVGTVLMSLAFAGAILSGIAYTSPLIRSKNERIEMARLSAEYYNKPVVSVSKHHIKVEHSKNLRFKSTLTLRNETNQPLGELIFSLNPGLKLDSVLAKGSPLKFERKKHIVIIDLENTLEPGHRAELELVYGGIIDQSVAYLDATEEKFRDFSTFVVMRADQQYSFQRNDYLLLTPEVIWYPVPGVRYDPKRPAVFRQQFTRFTLDVTTSAGLEALSQGSRTSDEPGRFSFKARDPLPQISLVVGNYDLRSTNIDGLDLSLAVIKGHNHFDRYLTGTSDTLNKVIIDFLDNFERPLNMVYPYPNFSLVEVPVQFKALQHSWTSTLENSQPQMVLLPEKGYGIRHADFKANLHWMKRRNERNNEGRTDEELKASLIQNFLQNVFGAENADINFMAGPNAEATSPNPFSIYPNYYYYINFISSDEYPVLNYAFESYLRKTTDDPRQMFMAQARGIGDAEKANLLLDGNSLKAIISNSDDQVALNRVLKVKGAYLLTYIQKYMGDQDFDKFLLDYMYNNSYKEIPFEAFASQMNERFGVELGHFIDQWYTSNTIPAYKVSDLSIVQTIDKDQMVYLVKAVISNHEPVDVLVKFSFRTGGGGGGRGGFMMFGGGNTGAEERIFLIGPNETKQIQVMLMEQPRGVTLNTMMSKNIPSALTFFRRNPVENNNIKAEEYERTIDRQVKKTTDIYIVDNEEPGFSTYDPADNNRIKQFFKKETDERNYVGMGFGNTPNVWSLTANADFYGEFIRSAKFVKSGTGLKTANWETNIENPGYYDVYVHLVRERSWGPGGRGGGGGGPGGGGRGDRDPVGSYFYTIHHDDGVEEVELKLKDVQTGWNLLGSYYISNDTAKVVLTDRSDASLVVADAVRWVKEGIKLED